MTRILPGTDVYARDLDTPTPRARRCRFNTLTSTHGLITRIWSLPVVGTGPVLRLTCHARVRDAEVQFDPGGGGVELRSDTDRFNSVKVNVELVLDIRDYLHK